jgi:hypothetical protein
MLRLRSYWENSQLRFIAVATMIIVATIAVTQFNGHNGDGGAEYNSSSGTTDQKEPESFWQITETDPVATFTGTLALFTLALVIISGVQIYFLNRSDKTARLTAEAAGLSAIAAKKSADAAVAIELPIIRARAPLLTIVSSQVPREGPALPGVVATLMPENFNTVSSVKVINRGRTVAMLSSICVGWDFRPVLPDIPSYTEIADYTNGVILPQEFEGDITLPRLTIECDRECQDNLVNKTRIFRFFISILFTDFMDNAHHTNFCWEWGCPDGVGEHHFSPVVNVPPLYYSKS